MATTNPQFTTTLAAFLIIAAITVSHDGLVSGQGCQADVQGLIEQCAMFVQRVGPRLNPSAACCNVVNRVDVPCVCKYITREIEQMIDMEKVAYVAAYCGKPLAPGTKCGSYTAPGSTTAGDVEESEAPIPGAESEAPVPGVEGEVPIPSEEGEPPFPSVGSEAPGPSVDGSEAPEGSGGEEESEAPSPDVDVTPWMPWIIRGPKY